jgi:hypothetical protein
VDALTDYAELMIARDQPKSALAYLTRARAVEVELPLAGAHVARTQLVLAEALVDSKGDLRRARSLAYDACRAFDQSGFRRREDALLSWFRQSPLDPGHRPVGSCADLAPGARRAQLSSPTSKTTSAG